MKAPCNCGRCVAKTIVQTTNCEVSVVKALCDLIDNLSASYGVSENDPRLGFFDEFLGRMNRLVLDVTIRGHL